jgi:hypothetical protein
MKNAWLVFVAALTACAAPSANHTTTTVSCPASLPFAYVDQARGFRICLPAGLQKGVPAQSSPGSVLFTGFAVPANTNLRSKQLSIISGEYDLLKSAKPFGQFTANGVTFKRAKFEEGSAGHLDLHVFYTPAGKNLHFDFDHHSVNVLNFDPSNRPAEYNRAAQIKFTEQIMSTFSML